MEIQSDTLVWRILLVEDDEDDYILTRDMLQEIRRGLFELTWVTNVDSAIQYLSRSVPDAILVDYDLGARNGLELIHEIKARTEKIPIIVYSGRGSYMLDVKAMQLGASDYLVKDEINPRLLERSIRYAIAQKGIEEELERRVRERTQDLASAVEGLQAENAERRRVEAKLNEREEKLLEQKERAELLVELSGKLAEVETDYQQLLDVVTSRTAELLGDFCSIFLVAENGQEIIPASLHNRDRKAEPQLWEQLFSRPYPASEGLTGQVVRSGEPVLIQDSTPEQVLELMRQEFTPFLQDHPVHSLFMVPLRSQGRTIGVLSVGREKPGSPFSLEDQSLLKDVAFRTTQAISNASLFRALQTELLEREKIEKALRSTSTFLETLIESSPDATLVVDPRGAIQRANAEAERIFGYHEAQLLGQPVEMLLPESQRIVHRIHRLDFASSPNPRSMGSGMELFGKRQDNSHFPVDVKLSPILLEDEPLVIAVVRDITERKAQEAELAEVQRMLMDSRERERLRIAQDIHDGPLQDLISITYKLQEYKTRPAEAFQPETIAGVQGSISAVSQELRALCGDLRPPTLAPFGLERAIISHAEEFQRAHPEFEIHLSLVADKQQIPENTRLALFRIYQQSLANILRHSKATQVKIYLNLDAEQVYLEITDNGEGFVVPTRMIGLVRSGHLGMAGMFERAQAIGGRLSITSAPGQGTHIRVEAPLGG